MERVCVLFCWLRVALGPREHFYARVRISWQEAILPEEFYP
jgi:hypothetical protein